MNEEKYILFGQYLAEELSVEEKIDFEKQLVEDQEFALSFTIFKELNLHLDTKFSSAEDLNAFKQNLKSISKGEKQKDSKVIAFKSWHYTVAASITLLIGLFLFQNINPDFEEYNHYEKAYFTERGSLDESLKQAQDSFNEGKYKESIPYFEAVLKENKSPEIQCFYAISLLESNQIQKAEANLNEIISGTSIYKNKATWFLALSKLKQKNYESCKEILLTIPEDFENYDQVQELLTKLD